MNVTTQWAQDWITACASVIAEHRTQLSELDREIGDGDHGENLDRGFQAVLSKLPSASPQTLGDVFKLVATTLMSTVGGAAGPLYGTAFLRAAKAADHTEIDAQGVADFLLAAAEGIAARGKAEMGDKTMLDAWMPAAQAAGKVAAAGGSAVDAITAAAEAAQQGALATEPLIARKGRASYLGERAIGHRDPGSQSTALILTAAADVARQR